MDTNIDNYSNNELIDILKITTMNKYILHDKYTDTINRINISDELDEVDKNIYRDFFKSVFIRLSLSNGYEIDELNSKISDISYTVNNKLPNKNSKEVTTINPFDMKKRTLNIHFDSTFRDNYYNQNPADFTYTLPDNINNIVSMRLSSVDIPSSWHTISYIQGTNRFVIEIKGNCLCNVYEIVVPDGNYTSDELISYLNNNYFYMSNTDEILKYIKISVNENSLRTVFELITEAPDDLTFTLHFLEEGSENIVNRLGWILGFRLSKYKDIEESIQSEGLIDTEGNRYIYFALDDYQKNKSNQHIVYFDKSTMNDSILGKIYLYNGRFSLNIFEDEGTSNTKVRKYFGPSRLSKFRVSLLNKFGDVIDLNQMDFSFSLELDILYSNDCKY